MSKKSRVSADAAGFVYDQQFAFLSLLPLAAVAVIIMMAGKRN
jgi:hypothetical protein